MKTTRAAKKQAKELRAQADAIQAQWAKRGVADGEFAKVRELNGQADKLDPYPMASGD